MRYASASGVTLLLVASCAVPSAWAQQGPNFNRVNTLRREVTITPGAGAAVQEADAAAASPAKGAKAARARRPSAVRVPEAGGFSLGNPGSGRLASPPTVTVRTTPHAFYPGMRNAQGPNRNVPTLKRSTAGRGFSVPGMGGGFLGLPGPSLSPGRAHR